MYTHLQAVSVYTFTSCECTHIYKLRVYTTTRCTCTHIYTLYLCTHLHVVNVYTFSHCKYKHILRCECTHIHAVRIHAFTRCTCKYTHIYTRLCVHTCTRCTRTKIDTLCILIDYHPMNNRRKVTNREFVIV